MSREIDQRIVEMQFDNAKFESNVKTSMKSLDKLNDSLKMDGASKGMTELGRVVDAVSGKMTALEVAGKRFIERVVDDLYSKGKNLVKSLTIDQVTAGWSKYAEKTASVKTIMNSTGKTVDEVNGVLSELMTFSDETSYSFNDMTSALAQMTNAGGQVENLIPMITGIANATAYAGKGAAEFSRTIYNLNQSYGSGFLNSRDWMSVEQAGVGGAELKRTLIETAKELGTLTEEGKAANGQLVDIGNFRDTLASKWATSEVMEKGFAKFSKYWQAAYGMVQKGEAENVTEAMKKLGDDYEKVSVDAFRAAQETKTFREAIDATKDAVSSQFLRIFESVFGNVEEATELWTDFTERLYNTFAAPMSRVASMFNSVFKGLGGRKVFVAAISNIFDRLEALGEMVKSAFRDIFPEKTASDLFDMLSALGRFTETLGPSEETMDKLKRTIKGALALFDSFKTILVSIVKAVFPGLNSGAGTLIDSLLSITASIGDFFVRMNKSLKSSEAFAKVIEVLRQVFLALATVIKFTIDKIAEAFTILGQKLKNSGIIDWFKNLKKNSSDMKDVAKNYILGFVNGAKSFLNKLKDIAVLIGTTFMSAVRKVLGIHSPTKEAYSDAKNYILGFVNGIKDYLSAIITSAKDLALKFLGTVRSVFLEDSLGIKQTLKEMFDSFSLSNVVKIFTTIGNALQKVWNFMKPVFSKIGEAIKAFWEYLQGPLGKVGASFEEVADKIIGFIREGKFKEIVELLKDFALFKVLNNLSKVFSSLNDVVDGFSKVGKRVSKAIKSFSKLEKALARKENTEAIKNVAIAIALLAGSFLLLALVPAEKIWSTLILLAAISGIAIGAAAVIGKISKSISELGSSIKSGIGTALSGTAFVSFSLGIIALAGALAILANVNFDNLEGNMGFIWQFFAMVAGLLAGAIIAKKAIKYFKGLGVGLLILVGAIAILNKIPSDAVQDGLAKMSEILLVLGVFAILVGAAGRIGKGKSVSGAVSLALGVLALVLAVKLLSKNVDPDAIKVAMAGVLTLLFSLTACVAILGFVSDRMKNGYAKVIGTVISLIVGVIAMALVVKMLSKMDPDQLKQGIIGVVELLGAIVVAIGIIGLVSALLKGGKMVGVIAAIIAITASLIALSVITGIFGLLGKEKIDYGLKCMIALIVGIAAVLLALTALGSLGGGTLIVTVLSLVILVGAMIGLAYVLGKFTDNSYYAGLIKLAAGLAVLAGGILLIGLAAEAGTIGIGFLLGLTALIVAFAVAVVAVGFASILLATGLGMAIDAVKKLIGIKFQDIIEPLGAMALGFLALALGVSAFGTAFGIMAVAVAGGILLLSVAGLAAVGVLYLFVEALNGLLDIIQRLSPELQSAGGDLILGFVNGILDNWRKLSDSVTGLFTGIVDKVKSIFRIGSPSKVFNEIGGFCMEGFANGIEENSGSVKDAFASIADDSEAGFKGLDLGSLFGDSLNLDPTITPILDLSNIENGSGEISKLLGGSGIDLGSITSNGLNIGSLGGLTPSSTPASAPTTVTVNMTINGAEGQDVDELADLVIDKINASVRRREVVWQ